MRRSLATFALFCAAAPVALAAPVAFNVTSTAFVVGSGYGVDANETNGTLLDVVFAANNALHSFTLAGPGSSSTFNFGTITLNEIGFINANETDNLGVSATFTFTDPLAGIQSVTATGNAVIGFVNDITVVDYSVVWNPLTVAFGNGGSFRIDMETELFRLTGQVHNQFATITLLAAPVVAAVPEPVSLALVGAALAGLGVSRRRAR